VKKVLVVSDKNEARSQMAEKWLKYYGKNHLEVWSAGLEKGSIHVLAQKAMAEAIMDIPEYKSKAVSELKEDAFDFILCFDKEVQQNIPFFAGEPVILLYELPNPASVQGEENVKLQAYNAVCNAIDDVCFSFVQEHFQIVS
jgi:protein-tyrosine-phosphatase